MSSMMRCILGSNFAVIIAKSMPILSRDMDDLKRKEFE